jgi:protein-tyrosine phosphatase
MLMFAAVSSCAAWHEIEADEFLPGLYLGNLNAAYSPNLLEHPVTHILSVHRAVPDYARVPSVVYEHVEVNDDVEEDIFQYFGPLSEWLHERETTRDAVLVHCQQGVSRSPTVVLAYLMFRDFLQAQHVLPVQFYVARLRAVRPAIEPNQGFMKQLEHWRQRLVLEKFYSGGC